MTEAPGANYTQAEFEAAVEATHGQAHAEGHAAGRAESYYQPAFEEARQAAFATSSADERERIRLILESPAGRNNATIAQRVAFNTDLSADQALAFMSGLPREHTNDRLGAVIAAAEAAAAASANPLQPTGAQIEAGLSAAVTRLLQTNNGCLN